MVSECPEWLKDVCYSGKDWSTAVIIVGTVLMSLQTCATVTLFVLYWVGYRAAKIEIQQQYYIMVCIFLTCVVRIPWWWMNAVTFIDNTTPAIVIQVLNRLAMLTMYLAQSFYLQTWLRILILFTKSRGQQFIKWGFLVTDIIVGIVMGFAIISRIFDRTEREDSGSGYGLLYDISTYIPACASLLLTIVYLVVGATLVSKLKNYYSLCSRTQIGFITVSCLLICSTMCRFMGLFYNLFFGEYLPSNVFAIVTYMIPDVVPCVTITVMEVLIYVKLNK